jgi:predicted transcriptional regulator
MRAKKRPPTKPAAPGPGALRVVLPDDLYKRLRRLARATRTSMNEVLRSVMQERIRKEGTD